jgi:hypothetical protein
MTKANKAIPQSRAEVPGAYWLYGLVDLGDIAVSSEAVASALLTRFPHPDMDLAKVIATAGKVVDHRKGDVSLHDIVKAMREKAPAQEFSFLDEQDELHQFFIAQVNAAAKKRRVPPYTPDINYDIPSPELMVDDGATMPSHVDPGSGEVRGRESPRDAMKRSHAEFSRGQSSPHHSSSSSR